MLCGTHSNEVLVQTYMLWHSNILKQKCGIDKDQYLFWKFLLSLCLRLFRIMLWLSFVHSFFVVTWMLAGESRLNFCFPKSNDGSVLSRWFSLHWVPVVSVPNNLFFLQPWCNIEGSCFLLSQPMPHCEFMSVRIFGFCELMKCSSVHSPWSDSLPHSHSLPPFMLHAWANLPFRLALFHPILPNRSSWSAAMSLPQVPGFGTFRQVGILLEWQDYNWCSSW